MTARILAVFLFAFFLRAVRVQPHQTLDAPHDGGLRLDVLLAALAAFDLHVPLVAGGAIHEDPRAHLAHALARRARHIHIRLARDHKAQALSHDLAIHKLTIRHDRGDLRMTCQICARHHLCAAAARTG